MKRPLILLAIGCLCVWGDEEDERDVVLCVRGACRRQTLRVACFHGVVRLRSPAGK
ncbi:hypothetical protein [Nostoc sp. MS1]|uniref:hypothetical protein n=1 Tax=Nostoc sp. MS1 TaxID=2764711 RepID=UPI001CC5C583|nr:hypothetical protein [Nostoc sp. MS1]